MNLLNQRKSTSRQALSLGLSFLVLFPSLFAQAEHNGPLKIFVKLVRDAIPLDYSPTYKKAPPHLKYFGYYASAMEDVGIDGNRGNYSKATSNHANMTMVAGGDIQAKMKEAKTLKMKVVLDCQSAFFDEKYQLRPDYKERWKAFAATLKENQDNILAFYPLDEPYGKGEEHGITPKKMKEQLELIGQEIKSTFPTKAVATIFTSSSVMDENFQIPKSFDWVGFDCYQKWNSCEGHSIPEYFEKLEKAMHPHQKIMAIGSAMTREENRWWMFRRHMGEIAEAYYTLAYNNPKVIAMMPFIYQTFDEGGDPKKRIYGIQDIPEALEAWTSIGQRITGRRETEANVDEVARLMKAKFQNSFLARAFTQGTMTSTITNRPIKSATAKPAPKPANTFPGGGILAFDTAQ